MPTETAKPRLIDANALEEIMKNVRDCDDAFGSPSEVATWNRAIKELQSATTVETTDVANKFFVEFMQSQNPWEQLMSAWTAGRFIEYVQKKKLEESLNRK